MDRILNLIILFINNIIFTTCIKMISYDTKQYTISNEITNNKKDSNINIFVNRKKSFLSNCNFLREIMLGYIYKIDDDPIYKNKLFIRIQQLRI